MWFGRKKWFGKDNADEVYLWIYSGTEGEILVNNQKVGVKDKFAENLGFIIETPGFMPNYTAYKNLEFLSSINSKVNKQRIREVIELVGLDPVVKRRLESFLLV